MDERLRAKVQESRIGERQKPPGAEEDADDAVFSDDEDHGGRDIASMDKAGLREAFHPPSTGTCTKRLLKP